MKNKYILSYVLILFGLVNLLGQKKYIEVLVKDTVQLKPIGYEFEVYSGLQFRYNHEKLDAEREFGEKLRKSEESIVKLLEQWGYEFELSENPEASFNREPTDKTNYSVKIRDSLEKEKFKARVKNEGFNFHMTNIHYEDKEPLIKELYARLLKKARTRVQLIAELSNAEIGELLEISESKSELSIISSFIENFAYSRFHGSSAMSFTFNSGVLEKSLLVKYSMK